MLSVLFGSFYGHIGKVNKYPYRGKIQMSSVLLALFYCQIGKANK